MAVRFDGKVAAVTGAGRGIGRAIVEALAREGASVVVADIDESAARQVVAALAAGSHDRAVPVKTNVVLRQDAEGLLAAAVNAFGQLDILVNNAGLYPTAPVLAMNEEEWDLVLAVNLKGTFLCSQAAARHMIDRRQGVIINIASVDAKTRTTGNAHYAAAKAGVISFTRTLACEVAPYGVRVNAVAPGWIATDTLLNKDERWKNALTDIPIGRMGTPQDVAEAVLFLASDVAGYITGEILDVNGGIFMD